jgi:hypothetical protein
MTLDKYSKYVVTKPDYEGDIDIPAKGRQNPAMTIMSNKLVPGSNTYMEIDWVWDMPSPNPHIFNHAHNFDEILLHIGSDYEHPEELGAEIEVVVEGKTLTINRCCGLFLPAGIRHGPLTWKKVTRPHLEIAIMLGTGDFREGWSVGTGPEAGNKAQKLIKKSSSISNPEKLLASKPVYEAGPGFKVKGRNIPSLTVINDYLIPNCNMYIEVGWIWEMPDPNPHVFEHKHKFNEVVTHIGNDYKNPEDLGAEIDFQLEGESHPLTTTSAVYIPKGTKHGPLIWKRVSRPHIEMAMMIGTGDVNKAWD